MQPTDTSAVVEALRAARPLRRHVARQPGRDALGSLLATHLALEALGKDSVMVLGGVAPLPGEYAFLELEARGLLPAAPPDVGERVLVAVDCAQESRIVEPTLVEAARADREHRPPSRQHALRRRRPRRRRTRRPPAEVLADVFAGLGIELTPAIAEALYTALVTDTGRFQYSNTTPKALRLAAELVEAGADVSKVFVEVYESTPFPKLKLLARALERATELADGRIVVSELRREDFDAAGAEEPYSEGIIDHLRAVDGAELVALVRELPDGASAARKGSLRSRPGRRRRVGDRPRASAAGGTGARQASRPTWRWTRSRAGSSTRSWPRTATARADADPEGARADGRRPRRQAGRARRRSRSSPASGQRTGAKTGHAGTLDPFATGLLVLLSGRATSLQDRFMRLDKRYLTEIDLRVTHDDRRPRGRRRGGARATVPRRARAALERAPRARSSCRSRPRRR